MSSSSSDPPKDRSLSTPQDEVILQLENELMELRNACAWKDQRIAELSRTDTPAARLKRDVRQLAAELHHVRKQLSESVMEVQELQQQLGRGEGAVAISRDGGGRDVVDSPLAGGGAAGASTASRGGSADRGGGGAAGGNQYRERIAELQEENRQLRETVMQLKAQSARPNGMAASGPASEAFDGPHHGRQPSGASTQRGSEPSPTHQASSGTQGRTDASGFVSAQGSRGSYMTGTASLTASQGVGGHLGSSTNATPMSAQQEEPLRPIVYSTTSTGNTATIGPTTLQGVGKVDGVASVAKILLQRIPSSVCTQARRGMAGQPPGAGQMQVVGMPGM